MVLQQGLAYDNDTRQIEYSESIMKMERFVLRELGGFYGLSNAALYAVKRNNHKTY